MAADDLTIEARASAGMYWLNLPGMLRDEIFDNTFVLNSSENVTEVYIIQLTPSKREWKWLIESKNTHIRT